MDILSASIALCQALHPFRNWPILWVLYSAAAENHLDQLNGWLNQGEYR